MAAGNRRICGIYPNFGRDVAIFSADYLIKKKQAQLIVSFKQQPQISVGRNDLGIGDDYFKVFKTYDNFEVRLMKLILLKKQKGLFSIQLFVDFQTYERAQFVDFILV